jgi:hypothetical protein
MKKIIIYGAGLIVVAFIVGLLLFLTLDNVSSGQAVYSNQFGNFYISGPTSILVNGGIVGMVVSLLSFIGYLFSRNALLLKSYKIIGAASGLFILIGLACSKA